MNTEKGSISKEQMRLIHAKIRQFNLSHEELTQALGFDMAELSMKDASKLIDILMKAGDTPDAMFDAKFFEALVAIRKAHGLGDTTPDPEAALKNLEDREKEMAAKKADIMERNGQGKTNLEPIQADQGIVTIGGMTISIADVDQLKKIPQLLSHIYNSVMVSGTDYGTIQGTQKPTLLKPGAELLRLAFGFDFDSELQTVIEDFDKGRFYYKVKTNLYRNGKKIGDGTGSANSEETKYSSRWVFESDIPDGIDKASLKTKTRMSKKNTEYKVYLVEPSLSEKATLVNTLQKMADKRSFVAAILKVTGASRIFTQDIEDFKEGAE